MDLIITRLVAARHTVRAPACKSLMPPPMSRRAHRLLLQSGARNMSIATTSDIGLFYMLVAFGRALLASALALCAVRVLLGMHSANCCALAAHMGAERAEITVMFGPSGQRIHRRRTDIRAIKIDQSAVRATFTDISCRARLASVNRFLTCFNAFLQIFLFGCHFYASIN